MKSPMIEANPQLLPSPEFGVKSRYTSLQVLQSAAGYYIGTMYEELDEAGEIVWQEPGSRDSSYYSTREAAEKDLQALLSDSEDAPVLRDHP